MPQHSGQQDRQAYVGGVILLIILILVIIF
jgi:hypothetical protein